MDKQILCIWDIANKPWIRVGLLNSDEMLQESEIIDDLSLSLRARLYLPECCADRILTRVLDEIADFNLRYKHFTDLFVMDAVAAENAARYIARSLLGDYHSLLMREVELQRRERLLEAEGSIFRNSKVGNEKIYVAFHWDSEWGIQAVGAYKDKKIAELECRMLALDCKYTYQKIYGPEFSLEGEVYGKDFFEKGGSGWNILDSEGNTVHKFRVEEIDVGQPIVRKNYSWDQIMTFIESDS